MIHAIVQIPNRLKTGTILYGGNLESITLENGTRINAISGRSIRIVPLIFYKFFSSWGEDQYEHIFVTDEPISTRTMSRYVDDRTGESSNSPMGAVLYPISVKRIRRYSVETYLFARSIDFLLSNYQIGTPLTTIPFCGYPSIDSNRSIEVPSHNLYSQGVLSYGSYKTHILQNLIKKYNMTQEEIDRISFAYEVLTTEMPSTIQESISEILYYSPYIENVWSVLSEVYLYENGEYPDLLEYLSQYSYTKDGIDPITVECLRSPTYILTKNLLPYLDRSTQVYAYANMATMTDDPIMNTIVPLQLNKDSYGMNSLIETLLLIPDDSYTIEVTWDRVIPHYQSVFGHSFQSSMDHSIQYIARQQFLNKQGSSSINALCDSVVISKNWYDELVFSCKYGKQVTNYYFNLAWFHLMSPSLVNRCLFYQASK